MVGRRGISKGCVSCRQRKKGCDMQRPACGQCRQRGSTCSGYRAGLTFVHDSRSVSSNETVSFGEQDRRLSVASTPPSLIRSAALVGFRDHFWYVYLPKRYASPGSLHGSLDEFFQAVEHISSHEIASKHAFWALSSLIIGREITDPRLLLQGSRMYSQALMELRAEVKKVRHSSLLSSAETAMTCNLLALYELFDDPNQTRFGFFTHSQGLAELVRLRGPNRFRSGVAWAAFQGVRVAIIISAIQRRHATFLSSMEWCTIPWHPESKPAWQRVIDVTAQVPELLERLDQIRQGQLHDDGHTESSKLLHHCLMLDRALQAWYEGLPTLFGLETSAELWRTKQSSETDSPFPTEIYFEDQIHGQALIFYWTTCVFVYGTMQKLAALHPTLPPSFSTRTDPYYYIARIVQSIPYFLQPSVGLLMRKIFAFPLATAYGYFASLPSGWATASSSGTSQPPASTVIRPTESIESAGSFGSPTACDAGNIDVKSIRTYLETTAKTMHIYGAQINLFCEPVSPAYLPRETSEMVAESDARDEAILGGKAISTHYYGSEMERSLLQSQ